MSRYEPWPDDPPTWQQLACAANLEHTGDWPIVEVNLQSATLIDWQDKITEEIIYADDNGPGWRLEYQVNHPYEGWDTHADLNEPANNITPGYLYRLFGDEVEAGATIRFQAVVVDSYDCDDCRDDEEARQEGQCDHTIGWALVWAQQLTATPIVQTL